MLKKTGNQDIFECKGIFFNEILEVSVLEKFK